MHVCVCACGLGRSGEEWGFKLARLDLLHHAF